MCLIQELSEAGKQTNMASFPEGEKHPDIITHLLMSDETHFHLLGFVNTENFR
jgi:hypothetical protein